MIIQSCSVYKSPVRPEEAFNRGHVIVKTTDRKRFKFDSLFIDKGQIYGAQKWKGVKSDILIPGERILYVRVRDPKASKRLTIFTVAGLTIFIGIPAAVLISLWINPLDLSGLGGGFVD